MTRRLLLGAVLLVALAAPVSAQLFGGIVYDPTNYANAVLRYGQLQQQLAQLITTYQQIRTQYLLLWEQSQQLPVNMVARYRSLASPWLPFTASSAYGTTAAWLLTANAGPGAAAAYAQATQPLGAYAGALAQAVGRGGGACAHPVRPTPTRRRQRGARPRGAGLSARASGVDGNHRAESGRGRLRD